MALAAAAGATTARGGFPGSAGVDEIPARGVTMRLIDCSPDRAYFTPGEKGAIRIQVSPDAVGHAAVRLEVIDLDRTVADVRAKVTHAHQTLSIELPPKPGMGYGLRLTLLDAESREVDRSETSVDVQRSWVDAPRYGFLSDFSPGADHAARADEMLRRHINVVQFYDWMYRHYQFLPPADPFTDVLGRTLSLASVKSAVTAAHERGMGAIAYGSVYGAESEYALKHKDELLYDAPGGNPISLSEVFYLQDVRPGPWRTLILGQYREAVKKVDFDGIHADQYGFPTEAYDQKGDLVEMGPALAGMVGAAQRSVVGDGGEGIIFNCVTNWPIGDVAPEPQLCMYIEVWPPYIALQDLFDLVKGARELAPSRQVILAAYMSCAAGMDAKEGYSHWAEPWGISDATTPDAAEAATLLTSATIHGAGGFHLLLGEGTGMLANPYYPKFVVPGKSFRSRLVQHWDFIVRYTAYLFDRSLEYRSSGLMDSGHLWTIHRSGPRCDTLSLINGKPQDQWNVLKPHPPRRRNVAIEMPSPKGVTAVFAANPDGDADAVRLHFTESGGNLKFTVPSVDIWTLIVVQHE
ncbi:MAG TPA: glycoside hydrolase family 66 protein [Chloroflexota bacterium]|nr:glycoside hydrolase family 66 protein [Chloroflexota bacterium]